MSVKALGDYQFTPRDDVKNFHGSHLLFVGWEDHLMFCSPVAYCLPPSTIFSELIEQSIKPTFAYHPDSVKINWQQVEWFKSGEPWQPDLNASLQDNGLGHKSVIRFRTPKLTGINNSYS